jgi:hypothetical protein
MLMLLLLLFFVFVAVFVDSIFILSPYMHLSNEASADGAANWEPAGRELRPQEGGHAISAHGVVLSRTCLALA